MSYYVSRCLHKIRHISAEVFDFIEQVYAPKANIVYLIDIKEDPSLISVPDGIRRVLESPTIIKVKHTPI